ncbi:hypothetical protein AVEN_35071-1 [Araneus ventricosus]|uniref:Uncharacterized protein n=1 Tax=Araneus ventricosus TaxID=182803 RepID=A0A4Y2J843_ARAVE|nr:hypothetical protein AVEN_35071-1 [Araneus ventricosus]
MYPINNPTTPRKFPTTSLNHKASKSISHILHFSNQMAEPLNFVRIFSPKLFITGLTSIVETTPWSGIRGLKFSNHILTSKRFEPCVSCRHWSSGNRRRNNPLLLGHKGYAPHPWDPMLSSWSKLLWAFGATGILCHGRDMTNVRVIDYLPLPVKALVEVVSTMMRSLDIVLKDLTWSHDHPFVSEEAVKLSGFRNSKFRMHKTQKFVVQKRNGPRGALSDVVTLANVGICVQAINI